MYVYIPTKSAYNQLVTSGDFRQQLCLFPIIYDLNYILNDVYVCIDEGKRSN